LIHRQIYLELSQKQKASLLDTCVVGR